MVDSRMYETLSSDYDRFVNWQNRLAGELPFILEKLQLLQAKDVLDAATGTGMHAIALAQLGYHTAGADLSAGMIERSHLNARTAGVDVIFEQAGFGALENNFGSHRFDAILCLGNSLPHLLSQAELSAALSDFAACLKPGGMLLIQNRNFDAIMAEHNRWMEPHSHTEGEVEWIFHRFYDFDPDGLITFNMVTLKKTGDGNWSQQVSASRLRPLLRDELTTALTSAGFTSLEIYGSMTGASFNPQTSSNLVIVARYPE